MCQCFTLLTAWADQFGTTISESQNLCMSKNCTHRWHRLYEWHGSKFRHTRRLWTSESRNSVSNSVSDQLLTKCKSWIAPSPSRFHLARQRQLDDLLIEEAWMNLRKVSTLSSSSMMSLQIGVTIFNQSVRPSFFKGSIASFGMRHRQFVGVVVYTGNFVVEATGDKSSLERENPTGSVPAWMAPGR